MRSAIYVAVKFTLYYTVAGNGNGCRKSVYAVRATVSHQPRYLGTFAYFGMPIG